MEGGVDPCRAKARNLKQELTNGGWLGCEIGRIVKEDLIPCLAWRVERRDGHGFQFLEFNMNWLGYENGRIVIRRRDSHALMTLGLVTVIFGVLVGFKASFGCFWYPP